MIDADINIEKVFDKIKYSLKNILEKRENLLERY